MVADQGAGPEFPRSVIALEYLSMAACGAHEFEDTCDQGKLPFEDACLFHGRPDFEFGFDGLIDRPEGRQHLVGAGILCFGSADGFDTRPEGLGRSMLSMLEEVLIGLANRLTGLLAKGCLFAVHHGITDVLEFGDSVEQVNG